MTLSGVHPYASSDYAASLAHLGVPVHVRAWNAFVLERPVDALHRDAIGPYPLLILDEFDLKAGIDELRRRGDVSLVAVVDGRVGPNEARLKQAFDFVRDYKTHYLVDPAVGPYDASRHHRYEIARAARRGVRVREVALGDVLEEWIRLYDCLVHKRKVSPSHCFTRESFRALSACPGVHCFAAWLDNTMVACHLWVRHGHTVWSHLAATDSVGYANGAAYAVYDASIRAFGDCVINVGGTAGIRDAANDGLAKFKSGFANATTTSRLVGTVLDTSAYETLCGVARVPDDVQFFPVYRAPSYCNAAPISPAGAQSVAPHALVPGCRQ